MCGILFVKQISRVMSDEELVNNCNPALETLKNRGPDSFKYTIVNGNYLGHTRLSVIDVGYRSDQPFTVGSYHIVFNGEIINYKELKRNLVKKGYRFKTSSDTEVLLCLYIEYGTKIVDMLEGMYAFVVYNSKTGKSFIARDRYGIKPLYVMMVGNFIAVSSTQRALLALKLQDDIRIDEDKINECFIFSYTRSNSILRDIKSIKQGYCAEIGDNLKLNHYYDVFDEYYKYNNLSTIEELSNIIEKVLVQWSVSDAKKAILLSGGVDSALISSVYMSNSLGLNSYTFIENYEQNNDPEYLNAKKTVDYLNIINTTVQSEFDLNELIDLANYSDTPMADLNLTTAHILAKKVNNDGNKVAFCGEGADEIFGGYDRYFYCYNMYKKSKDKKYLKYGMNYLSLEKIKELNGLSSFEEDGRDGDVDQILSVDDIMTGMLMYDQKNFLQSRLNAMDTVGGYNGIEIRTPFVDRRIIQAANSFYYRDKSSLTERKKIIFNMFSDQMPAHLLSGNKSKLKSAKCFSMYNHEIQDYLIDNIGSSGLENYFSRKKIELYLNKFKGGDKQYEVSLSRLFALILYLNSIK